MRVVPHLHCSRLLRTARLSKTRVSVSRRCVANVFREHFDRAVIRLRVRTRRLFTRLRPKWVWLVKRHSASDPPKRWKKLHSYTCVSTGRLVRNHPVVVWRVIYSVVRRTIISHPFVEYSTTKRCRADVRPSGTGDTLLRRKNEFESPEFGNVPETISSVLPLGRRNQKSVSNSISTCVERADRRKTYGRWNVIITLYGHFQRRFAAARVRVAVACKRSS